MVYEKYEGLATVSLAKPDNMEAGPSRRTLLEVANSGRVEAAGTSDRQKCEACRRRRRQRLTGEAGSSMVMGNPHPLPPSERRPPRKPSAKSSFHQHPVTLSVIFLALLPPIHAAPPLPRPMLPLNSPTYLSSPTALTFPDRRGLATMTTNSWPSNIPTSVSMVHETALPYVLTQIDDGTWSKIGDAWFLYGRQAVVSSSACSTKTH